jgi:hypothetical protein
MNAERSPQNPRPNAPDASPDDELDDRLDEALEETFPASDPIAVHRHQPRHGTAVNRPADPAVPTPKEKPQC